MIQDDLRDYRFYSSDMIHINDQGTEYVWEHFKQACIAKKCETVMKKVDTVQKGLHHRPFDEKSQAHQDFLKKLELNVLELKERYQIDFYSETY